MSKDAIIREHAPPARAGPAYRTPGAPPADGRGGTALRRAALGDSGLRRAAQARRHHRRPSNGRRAGSPGAAAPGHPAAVAGARARPGQRACQRRRHVPRPADPRQLALHSRPAAPPPAEPPAAAADRRLAEARRTGLPAPAVLGIPIVVKDVLCVQGLPATAGSRILEGFRPPFTATAVQRLLDAGAVLLGKTNTDEFAMGSSTENSAFGVTPNPWALHRGPRGSSGGAAGGRAPP